MTLLLESKRKREIKVKEKLRHFNITSKINMSITLRVITPVRLHITKIIIMVHMYPAVFNKVGFPQSYSTGGPTPVTPPTKLHSSSTELTTVC